MDTALSELLAGMKGVSAENRETLCEAFALAEDTRDMALARAEESEGRAEEAERRASEAEARADKATVEAAIWKSHFIQHDLRDEVHRAYVAEHFASCFGVEDGKVVARDPKTGKIITDETGDAPASIDEALLLLVAQLPDGHVMLPRKPDPMEATHYTPPAEKKKRLHSTPTSSTEAARRS